MSTRCQIEFRENFMSRDNKRYINRVTMYQHHDGYPDSSYGVIAKLKKFLKWAGYFGDIEYLSANFIYFSKKELEKMKLDVTKGYGICENDKLHGDIDYYYILENKGWKNNKELYIKVYKPKHTRNRTVKGKLIDVVKLQN